MREKGISVVAGTTVVPSAHTETAPGAVRAHVPKAIKIEDNHFVFLLFFSYFLSMLKKDLQVCLAFYTWADYVKAFLRRV